MDFFGGLTSFTDSTQDIDKRPITLKIDIIVKLDLIDIIICF